MEHWQHCFEMFSNHNILIKIQQNSVTWLAGGPDMCYVIKYITLSDDTYTDVCSYSTFHYCSYTRTVQLIRGVFHLGISFLYW
jgi:hypothetical protein